MITLDQGGGARGRAEVRACAGAASRLAESSWIQALTPSRAPVAGWRVVPDVHPHLLVHRLRDGRTRSLVVGPRSRFLDISQAERRFTVGLRLRPGVLPALLGTDAWVLRDRAIALCDAVPRLCRRTAERIEQTEDAAEVERLLLALVTDLDESVRVDWRTRGFVGLVTGAGRPGVADAAARLGISERSLRDTCRRDLGMRPKEVQRVTRLLRAIGMGLEGRADSVSAHEAGFADHAHLIRESRALLGCTPAAFRARARADSFKTGQAERPDR